MKEIIKKIEVYNELIFLTFCYNENGKIIQLKFIYFVKLCVSEFH